MKRPSVTMKVEVVENGLVLRMREGNRWGEKRWVVGFRDEKIDPFGGLFGGETVQVGEIVREFLFGRTKTDTSARVATNQVTGHVTA